MGTDINQDTKTEVPGQSWSAGILDCQGKRESHSQKGLGLPVGPFPGFSKTLPTGDVDQMVARGDGGRGQLP